MDDQQQDQALLPFIYRGEPAPRDITRALIDPSIDTIFAGAFNECQHLTHVEVHERVRRIERGAFKGCSSLIGFDFRYITIIEQMAFAFCTSLTRIEFRDKLERIEKHAFTSCTSIRWVKIPKVITIQESAFVRCRNLTYVEIGEGIEIIEPYTFDGCTSLRYIKLVSVTSIRSFAFRNCEHLMEFDAPLYLKTIGHFAFDGCRRLVRISIPLTRELFRPPHDIFRRCERLSTVDLIGDIHETISSLGLKQWQQEMNDLLGSVNQNLLNDEQKASSINLWLASVHTKIDHFRIEHNSLLKEALSLLELALWKVKIDEHAECCVHLAPAKKAKMTEFQVNRKRDSELTSIDDRISCRLECGANVVIENVLPFLHKFQEVVV